jgi:hypothetical protein
MMHSVYVASNARYSTNSEHELGKAMVAIFGVLWLHFLGRSKDNHENWQSRRTSGRDMKYAS